MPSVYQHSQSLKGHDDAVNSITFNASGSTMATGGDDGKIMIWSVKKTGSFTPVQTISEPYGRWGQITCEQFTSPRGSAVYPIETLVCGTGRGYVLMFREDHTGGLFEEIHGYDHFGDPVEAIACNSADQLIATSHSGHIRCWDISKHIWKQLWERKMVQAIPRSVIFDPTGSMAYVFGLETGDRFTLSTDTGECKETRHLRTPIGWVSASSGANRFLVDTISGPFVIFNLHSNTPSMTLSRPEDTLCKNSIKQGYLAEDGNIAVCGSNDGRVLIYDLQSNSPTTPSQVLVHRDNSPVQTLAVFSFPDNHIIVSCPTHKKPNIRVWMRTRIVHDAPLEEPKPRVAQKETPPPPPEAEVDPIVLAVLALAMLLGWAWYHEETVWWGLSMVKRFYDSVFGSVIAWGIAMIARLYRGL